MKKICIVSSMYYKDIMKKLLDGADDEIEVHKKHWKEVFKKILKGISFMLLEHLKFLM